MDKLHSKNTAIIVNSEAIDYAERKYVFIGEWQTNVVGSGEERRSPSIVIHKEATRKVTCQLSSSVNQKLSRRLSGQNGSFPSLPSFLFHLLFFFIPGTNTRSYIHTYIHTYIRACERSASGICNAKLLGTKVINYALRATAVCNNRVAEARTPACTIIGPGRFSSLYIFSRRMILCIELLEDSLLQRGICWTMALHRSLSQRRIKGNAEL